MERNKKSIILYLTLLGIFFVSTAEAGEKLQLVYPVDNIVAQSGSMRLIGYARETNKNVTITVKNNGNTTPYEVKLVKESFFADVVINDGENEISILDGTQNAFQTIHIKGVQTIEQAKDEEVLWYSHSKGMLTDNCDSCHQINLQGKNNYKHVVQKLDCTTSKCHHDKGIAKFVHSAMRYNRCVGCHNPHGTKYKLFLENKRAALCYKCHQQEESAFNAGVIHHPVKKGNCLVCHDPHQSDLEFSLKENTIKNLCAGCHGIANTEYEYMHEPVESGDCTACHKPHNSKFKYLLHAKGNKLCLTCHEIRKEEFEQRFVHEPVRKNCSLCHDPHGSETEYHLRSSKDKGGNYAKSNQPIKTLCLSCHTKMNPEITEQIESSRVPHKPVSEGKCTECHTPHSTNYPKQLNKSVSEVCFQCHKKMEKLIKNSLFKHGPVRLDECFQCHQVHGSENDHLLKIPFFDKFYGEFSVDKYALCFSCHSAKLVFEEKSIDTGFRNGLDNLHFVHVKKLEKGRNCKTCHDIHASNQKHHIREKIPYKKRFAISMKYSSTITGGGCVVGCHKPRDYDRENAVQHGNNEHSR